MLIEVCIGSSCHLKGAYNIIQLLQSLIEDHSLGDLVELKAVFCMENCRGAVSARIGNQLVSLNSVNTKQIFEKEVLRHLL
ncbi:MAG: (2Fe-2S) ferredoxin domain-containing protein [Eubacteriales bacterium]